jgi:pimeloyl-ACP methyl ester carboxylesterase
MNRQQVLLLHCSAGSGRQWDELTAGLDPRFRAFAPDLYGYGESEPWSGPGTLTLAEEAAHAASCLPDDRGPVHLVGHSYGGAVALRFAATRPWRVRSLTLIEPVAFHMLMQTGDAERRLLESVRGIASRVIEGVLSGDYYGAMEEFVDYWNGDGAWSSMAPEVRRRFSFCAPKVVLDFHAAINEDTAPDVYRRRFSFPVQILRGGSSPEPSRRVAELLSEWIPSARLTTVEKAGHMLPFTHADAVHAVIRRHMEQACGSASQAVSRAA